MGRVTLRLESRSVGHGAGGDLSDAEWARLESHLPANRGRGGREMTGRPTHDPVTGSKQWNSKGVTILREPYDAGFGLTFLAADPDGNRIRVAPQD